ncbi:hypothetical protein [Naasia lichenicola]|uniref:Uncharacterized protein n=1 Tax=Naasia lichenicola TaxID=2565933 RepID=A0A4S4FPZ9_9MICO|nr:hypothetical protein [Naasia lichenicola]THG30665.1 hypothetical protein E6C64_08475 [Naasia lichenicola]THG31902.1 hypothetical protein E6C64_07620 [Naasia lichenicola]
MGVGVQYYGQNQVWDSEANMMATTGRPGDLAYASDTTMFYRSNGSGWFPTDALRVLRGTAPVNLAATGSTLIYTLAPTSFRFVVIGVHVEILSLTGNVLTQAQLAVGATGPNYADIAASQGLLGTLAGIGLTSSNALTLASARAALNGGTAVYAKVNTPATGLPLTAYTARLDLMGYFQV